MSGSFERAAVDAARASDPRERIASIDVLRGIALFGVMAVNLVEAFRVSLFQQFGAGEAAQPVYDKLAGAFVHVALHMKAFALFSFLFGVSLAILYDRLSGSGRPLYWLSRRLAALLVFGLVHLLLIWNGDILTEYALAGFVVLPLLAMSNRALGLAAIVSLLAFIALPALPLLEWPDADFFSAHAAQANHVYATGSFSDIWRFSLSELPLIALLHAYVFPRTIALFLIGALAWRAGVFRGSTEDRERLFWVAVGGCAIGGFLTLTEYGGVRQTLNGLGMFRNALPSMAPVILALGYGAAIIAFMQSRTRPSVLRAFAPLGRMAFTNYILQSLVFAFVFFGYGLGYFGQLGPFVTLALGTALFALQCWASALWLRYYRFGPLEWLWRTLMYGRVQPMRHR